MPLHIVKLAVGADTVEDMAVWQAWQAKRYGRPVCGTRSWPKRAAEVLEGGALYWVVKGMILVRQRIVDIAEVDDEHGRRCGLWLDPMLVRTAPRPKKAFQGWRYLAADDAPEDLGEGGDNPALPEPIARELREIGAW